MTEIVWHGRGGQGAFTAARILGVAATLFGDSYALSFPTFGPERRGAPVLGFTKIGNARISDRSEIHEADYRIFLDETLYADGNRHPLKSGGMMLINGTLDVTSRKIDGAVRIDAICLSNNILGKPIVNTALLGALAAVWNGISLDSLKKAILHELKPSVANKNVTLLNEAYNMTKGKLT
jgi:pyruvate ferredoxin oxidoreductase gamma subunit